MVPAVLGMRMVIIYLAFPAVFLLPSASRPMEGSAEALLGLVELEQVDPASLEELSTALQPVAVAVPAAQGLTVLRVMAVSA